MLLEGEVKTDKGFRGMGLYRFMTGTAYTVARDRKQWDKKKPGKLGFLFLSRRELHLLRPRAGMQANSVMSSRWPNQPLVRARQNSWVLSCCLSVPLLAAAVP